MRFRTPFRRGITRFLPYFYSLPVDVSVHVVRQKSGKADNDGNVSRIRQTCQHPQNNQRDVVRGIRQRERRTAPERQINRQKTRRDGNRAGNQIRRVKVFKHEIEQHRHRNRAESHINGFARADFIHPHLRFVFAVRIAQSSDQMNAAEVVHNSISFFVK